MTLFLRRFHAPSALSVAQPGPAVLSAFEEFWESEAPRIGEIVTSVIDRPPPLVGWRAFKAGIKFSREAHTSAERSPLPEPSLHSSARPNDVLRQEHYPPDHLRPLPTMPAATDEGAKPSVTCAEDSIGEGLRSLADDGTVYRCAALSCASVSSQLARRRSIKHGHRIPVEQGLSSTPYERILADLRDEKGAPGSASHWYPRVQCV